MTAKHAHFLKDTYDALGELYNQKLISEVAKEEATVFLAEIPEGGQILDLGCGKGTDGAEFLSKGYKVTLFDLSNSLLEIAKKIAPDAKVIQGDMIDYDFGVQQYDGVWAQASLLHLTKKEMHEILKKIYTMLTDKGAFHLSLKKGSSEEILTHVKNGKTIERFFALYEKDEIVAMLEQTGFKVIHVRETQSITTVTESWLRIIAKKE